MLWKLIQISRKKWRMTWVFNIWPAKRFLLNWYIFIAYFFEVVLFLKFIDLWEWLLTVLEQNGSERKSWQYLNFYTNTEGSVFYWICFILFTKYKNGRFYSCLDYIYKHSRKVYVYKANPTVVAFIVRDIL